MKNIIFRIASIHISKTEAPDNTDNIITKSLERHSPTILGVLLKTLDANVLLPAADYITQQLSKNSEAPKERLIADLGPIRQRLISSIIAISKSSDVIAYMKSLIPEDMEEDQIEGFVKSQILELKKSTLRYLRRIENIIVR